MEMLKTVYYCCSILTLIFVFNHFVKIKKNYLLCYFICYLLDTETNNNCFHIIKVTHYFFLNRYNIIENRIK